MSAQTTPGGNLYFTTSGELASPASDQQRAINRDARDREVKAVAYDALNALARAEAKARQALAAIDESGKDLSEFRGDVDHVARALTRRLEGVETIAGLAPGEVTDAQTANLVASPDTSTRAAVEAATADTISDVTSPAHNAVIDTVGEVIPPGMVTSLDFDMIRATQDPTEEAEPGTILLYFRPPQPVFDDFTSATVGQIPSGWSSQFSPDFEWTTVEDNTATGGVALQVVGDTVASSGGMALNAAFGTSSGEIVFKWKTNYNSNPARGIVAASGPAGNINGYHGGVRAGSDLAMGRLTNDVQTMPLGNIYDFPTSRNVWYVTRLRKQDNQLMSRTWEAIDPEPADWQVTATDDTHDGGWWGLYTRKTTAQGAHILVHTYDWFGFAPGAQTAPVGE